MSINSLLIDFLFLFSFPVGHSKNNHDEEKNTKVKKEEAETSKDHQQSEEHPNGLVNKLSEFKFKKFLKYTSFAFFFKFFNKYVSNFDFKYTNFGPVLFFHES